MAKKKSGGKGWVMTAARQAYYASKKKGGGGKSPISGSFASNALKSGHVKIIVTKSRKKFSVAPIKRTPAQRLAFLKSIARKQKKRMAEINKRLGSIPK